MGDLPKQLAEEKVMMARAIEDRDMSKQLPAKKHDSRRVLFSFREVGSEAIPLRKQIWPKVC